MTDAFMNAQEQFYRAADIACIDDDMARVLSEPRRVIEASIPVRMDDGSVRVFAGFRSQHSDALGPYKGGIRFHPQVTREEIKALSMWMTWKCALAGIPFGGGKGGIIVDPKALSKGELERLSRGYIRAIHRDLGQDIDVPAPDVNTNAQIMAWMLDEFEKVRGSRKEPAVITGKPVSMGGIAGREEATAMGGIFVLMEALKVLSIRKKTIAIQGIGNVGGHIARLLAERDYTILALSDSKGAIYSEKGLDLRKVWAHKKATGSVVGTPDSEEITSDELLALPVSVLIPAALENVITEKNAASIKAEIILEMANGPTTVAADKILFDKGVIVIPDVLANSGGVSVSHSEWQQNREGSVWPLDKVNSLLGQRMQKAFLDVYNFSKEKRIEMRLAAQALAIKRVADAERMRGI